MATLALAELERADEQLVLGGVAVLGDPNFDGEGEQVGEGDGGRQKQGGDLLALAFGRSDPNPDE